MKSTRLLPVIAAVSTSVFTMSALASEAVFYITEEGKAAEGVSVSVNGQRRIVSPEGFVAFDLPDGDYTAELSQFGEFIGEASFTVSADTGDVVVEILGGEAVGEPVSGSGTGVLSGRLTSQETGGPVSGARISVAGSDAGAMTDDDGRFSLQLPRGAYTLSVAHPSYSRKELKDVHAIPGQEIALNVMVGMSGNGVIEEVVAIGTYNPESATSQERDASAVLDSIGSEQMSQFGDSSAAAALKRVAGVSMVGGQFAVVRGLQGRYISSTLNGGLMPSTDPMKRDVPLDLFPSSVLGNINIQKTFTPELPGDTTGGIIMMNTKDLPDGPVQKISGTMGLNTRTTFSDVAYYDGGSMDFLGVDDGDRDIPAEFLEFSADGKEKIPYVAESDRTFCEAFDKNCAYPEDAVRIAQSFSNNYAIVDAQAKPEKGFSYLRGNLVATSLGDIGYYGAVQYKDKWSARHDAQTNDFGTEGTYERTKRAVDATGYFVAGFEDENMVLSSKTVILRKTDNTVKVSHTEDEDEGIDTDAVVLQWVERQFLAEHILGQFFFTKNSWIDWRVNLGQSRRDEPDRRKYSYRNGIFIASDSERRYSTLVEDSLDLGLDYTYEHNFSDYTLMRFKAGAMSSEKDREVELTRVTIEIPSSSGVDLTLPVEQITGSDNVDAGYILMQTNTAKTDSYTATDSVQALYASLGFDFGPVELLAGARSETSEQVLTYPDAEGLENSLESDNLMPMASVTVRVTDDLQIRGAVSQTISRPGITERSESLQYDPETDEQIFGAPDLEISTIDNLDLRAEYYFSEEESASVAWFNKDIALPIERTIPDASGSAADGVTFRNEESATISGIEIDVRKVISEIGSTRFTVAGNASFLDANVVLSAESARFEGQSERRLQGQSELLGNLQFILENEASDQTLTLLANYAGDRIAAASRSVDPEFEESRMVVDLVYKWQPSDVLEVSAKAGNITDSPVEYTRSGITTEKYFEGTDINFSVSYEF